MSQSEHQTTPKSAAAPTPPPKGIGDDNLPLLTHIRRDPEIEANARPIDLKLYKRIFGYAKPYPRFLKFLLLLVVLRAIQLPPWNGSAPR